ncbi:unnamed protein product, partial [Notodromas monacha]
MLLATYAKLDPSRLRCVVEQLRDMEPHRKSRYFVISYVSNVISVDLRDMEPHRKSRYFVISYVSNVISVDVILAIWSNLPQDLLKAHDAANVSFPLMASSYRNLFSRHVKGDAKAAFQTWIVPLLNRCDGKAEDLLKNLVIVDSKVAASMCDALDFEKVTEPQLRLV